MEANARTFLKAVGQGSPNKGGKDWTHRYRIMLIAELVEKARTLGLWTAIPATPLPDPSSPFSIVISDLIYLLDHLPMPADNSTFEQNQRDIGRVMRSCRSALVHSISPRDMYAVMLMARHKAKTQRKTRDDLV